MPRRLLPRAALSRAPALLLSLFLTGTLACVKRQVDYEREYARSLAPKTYAPPAAPAPAGARPEAPPHRTVRVRLYADEAYRAQGLHWERDFTEQLRRASQDVEGTLGVVFELDSARPCSLPADTRDLEGALVALEALDPGDDVDLVVGLLPALRVFTASHNDLGRARMFGRHMVLRGMENPEEHQQILGVLSHLPSAEQDALYRERKLHKETSVLLHEWAHTLGAFHESDSHWTMAPVYDVTQAGFSPPTLQLLALSLRHVPQARRDVQAQKAWAAELTQLLSTTAWPAWEGPAKQEVLAWAERVQSGEEPLTREPPQQLSAGDRKRFEQVVALEHAGRLEVAAQTLEPLVPRYRRNAAVQVMACYLSSRVAPSQPSTADRCEAADKAFPEEASPALNLASLRLQAKDPEGAEAHLVRARARLQAHPPEENPGVWLALAGLLRNASCVSWAEEAAAQAKGQQGAEEVATWAARTRHWMGLPPPPAKSAVPPEQEGRFVRRVRDIEALLERGASAQARTATASLGKDFPGAPLVLQLQCEAQVRTGQLVPARALCLRALEAQEDLVQAHFLLGWMADAKHQPAEARPHLERVVALEPAHEEAWRLLARQYRAGGQGAQLEALKARYRAQFARELP
ncbi:hypothetical protein FGE12_11750 [Aggregicoccus sp. 17bor-14]|uniref:hypothetical protein n=1 Tax=Myxococcaceae TaxID=31 RepID=UPI00129C6DC7|nr:MULTISPECIES: hypothetical protein [Myxococcaceae]MBF5043062.1 hypothetical protein [Simulacricoccus sp. 17bor-14]MRI88825.1 hypothetical protein [Aggregicoccus sp. 17bor-14]